MYFLFSEAMALINSSCNIWQIFAWTVLKAVYTNLQNLKIDHRLDLIISFTWFNGGKLKRLTKRLLDEKLSWHYEPLRKCVLLIQPMSSWLKHSRDLHLVERLGNIQGMDVGLSHEIWFKKLEQLVSLTSVMHQKNFSACPFRVEWLFKNLKIHLTGIQTLF